MRVGIVGLGLIGGSMAKAFKRDPSVTVFAEDLHKNTLDFARLMEDVDNILTEEDIPSLDLILLATYPEGAENWLQENKELLTSNTLVVDLLGVKRRICDIGFRLAQEHGFTFAGGHPMAGTHNSGFKYAREDLFDGASMVIVPPRFDDIALLDRIKAAFAPARFGSFTITTAEKHDEMIAFTSQLAHVVSNAYIKSPTALAHDGFSAGSYKDLTRVAWLNPMMWTELFLENADMLNKEIDFLIKSLTEYRDAIAAKDEKRLFDLLDAGRRRKKEIDDR